jgi:signal recognition particle receptor subunit beta
VAPADPRTREIHGRIAYLGPAGSGKTSNLQQLARKLKREHCGELVVGAGGADAHERLPVALGEVRGVATSLEIVSAPGADHAADLRRRLLEGVDGVAFVADPRPGHHESTEAALEELRRHFAAYGRSLDEIPLVIQYNHRDEVDENAIERLHRRLDLKSAVALEAVAHEGKGVLQTLTTLSKLVLAQLRRSAEPRAVPGTEATPARSDSALSATVHAPARAGRFRLTCLEARATARGSVALPLVLTDESTGTAVELTLQIDLRPVSS